MQDQTSPRDATAELDQLERVVLHLLLDAGSHGLWSEREVAQAIGSDVRAAHALVNLHSSGLIHRLEEFVFATRPARRFHQLEEAG
jgi:hypothetical protein